MLDDKKRQAKSMDMIDKITYKTLITKLKWFTVSHTRVPITMSSVSFCIIRIGACTFLRTLVVTCQHFVIKVLNNFTCLFYVRVHKQSFFRR